MSCNTDGAFRAEVATADGSTTWSANALTFDTAAEAGDYAIDLARRWTLVRMARVVPSDHPRREPVIESDPGPLVVDYR
jgi:hypothetical protein